MGVQKEVTRKWTGISTDLRDGKNPSERGVLLTGRERQTGRVVIRV
jgi:hypothetical protein